MTTLTTTACLFAATAANAAEDRIYTVDKVPAEAPNRHYPSNRPPLATSPLVKLPVGAVRPEGWLRAQLVLQADGFIGHLTEISGWCRAENNAWLSPEGKGGNAWQEVPYWLRGFGDTGYLLKDERIITEARKWIEGILASQREDGWFGPRANLSNRWGNPDLLPNQEVANALQTYYEFSGDERVIDLLTKYCRYQLTIPDKDFIARSWSNVLATDNMVTVYWLYNRTGDKFLLELAERLWRNMAQWKEEDLFRPGTWGAYVHGVCLSMSFRAPTVWWMQAKQPELLEAAYRNYDKIYNRFGRMPGGMFGAMEQIHMGHEDPRTGSETCSMAEMMFSCEILTGITGDPLWAERCEDVALNSYPASQTPDLKGLRYFTAPNMALAAYRSVFPFGWPGFFTFDPYYFRCCQHNAGFCWPYYAEHLWMATADNGLCASLYCASEVTAKVGAEGAEVTIAEETDYPFGEQIALTVSTAKAVSFPLYLRIPGWCKGARVAVNGKDIEARTDPRSYLVIDRAWSNGDKVDLTLPMELGVRVWAKNKNSVSVDRGPLSFSLKIGEEWKRFEGPSKQATDKWPAYEVLPTTPWNYGLVLDPANPGASIEVAAQRPPDAKVPFAPENAPVVLKAKARKIPAWTADWSGMTGLLQDSPALTEEPLETVTLIPMGCARLRISAFPVASTNPDAHPWQSAEGITVTDLKATMENGWDPVVLTWQGSKGACEIRRDGTVIAASHPGLTYTDSDPPPGKTCTYTVRQEFGLTAVSVTIAIKEFDPSPLPVINIDINGGAPPGPTYAGKAAASIPGTRWNGVTHQSTGNALVDSAGAVTTVTFDLGGAGGWNNPNGVGVALDLLRDCAHGPSQAAVFHGLKPGEKCLLVLYGAGSGPGSNQFQVDAANGGVSGTCPGGQRQSLANRVNYVVLPAHADAKGDLKYTFQGNHNGLQLIRDISSTTSPSNKP